MLFTTSARSLLLSSAAAALVATLSSSHALAADPQAPGDGTSNANATSKKTESGGYGAPELKFTPMASSLALLMGSQGGWIINHRFIFGGAGYGLVNDVSLDRAGQKSSVGFGYGGFRPGLILGEREDTLHFTAGVVLGAAGISVGNGQSDVSWVVEPDVGVDAALTRWLRVGISGSYRFVGEGDASKLSFAQLSGPAAGIQFKFGSF
jgi:hypothetical protein